MPFGAVIRWPTGCRGTHGEDVQINGALTPDEIEKKLSGW